MSHHARTHIKALMEELRAQASDCPLPARLFLSGLLAGLSAAVKILDGGTAEKALEEMVQRLSSAVGEVSLAGQLPSQSPSPDTEPRRQLDDVIKSLGAAETELAALRRRNHLAHKARRAAEHKLDGIRRALCDIGAMQDDDPYSHADLENVIRQAGRLDELAAAVAADLDSYGEEERADTAPATDPIAEENARRHKAAIARVDELLADAERVRVLYERWVKAGSPPLGTSLARWWDQRLVELRTAVLGTKEER
ncbi:hypothetical protein QBB34_21270 [Streptomyces stelliscabiei]|uniref:hypothetical protein n=1 Tax=Streptomyces stelliscabiei TaxID=146820 RepID=UPI002FF25CA6